MATHKAGGQVHDFFFPFVNRFKRNAVGRAAISFTDYHVLGHIHQLTGHVAGVGRLERGIRQALACAVRGDEVLQHRQPLAEV